MSLKASLGSEIELRGERWRVIRIVNQEVLVSVGEEKLEVVTESYLELKNKEGKLDFEVLTSERTEYSGVESTIKAPEPVQWKRD